MWAYRTLFAAHAAVGWLLVPLRAMTTPVFNALAWLTFGLVLYPIGLVWLVCFQWPLLGLSRLWQEVSAARIPLAVVGAPLALAANAYARLLPFQGGAHRQILNIFLAESWPYSLEFWLILMRKSQPSFPGTEKARRILEEAARRSARWPYLVQAHLLIKQTVSLVGPELIEYESGGQGQIQMHRDSRQDGGSVPPSTETIDPRSPSQEPDKS